MQQGLAGRCPDQSRVDRPRLRGGAVRFHGPRRQRGGLRQHQLLLERRRPRRCRKRPACSGPRTGSPDRPQPGWSSRARRGLSNSGVSSRRHARCARRAVPRRATARASPGYHRSDRRSRRETRRACIPHSQGVPRGPVLSTPRASDPQSRQGALDPPRAARRGRRDRECLEDLPRGPASQELRVPRRRRPPAQAQSRRDVRRRSHRRLGVPLRAGGPRGRRPRARPRRGRRIRPGQVQRRTFDSGRTTSPPTSPAPKEAWTSDRAPTTCCSRRSAVARR